MIDKRLKWGTFWGRHLGGVSLPSMLALIVLVLTSVLVFVAGLLPAGGQPTREIRLLRLLLEWSAVLVAWGLAGLAAVRYRVRRDSELIGLAWVFAFLGSIDAVASIGGWLQGGGEASWSLFGWTLGRIYLVVALLATATLATAVADRRIAARWISLICGLSGLAVLIAVATAAAGLHPGWRLSGLALPRPWELPPAFLLLLGAFFLFPQLHRLRPTLLSHALILASVPFILCHLLLAWGSPDPFSPALLFSLGLRLLGYVALLVGLAMELVQTSSQGQDAVVGLQTAQLELDKRSREIERIDQQLVVKEVERRRAASSLRMLEKAVETMSLGVTITNLEGKILYVNPADAEMHGYKVEELQGKSARTYAPQRSKTVSPDSPPETYQAWTRERINVTRSGEEFHVRLVSDVVRGPEDESLAVVTLCEDIGEQLAIREALERRERILEVIGLATESFLGTSAWEQKVEQVLKRLGEATRADRVYLSRFDDPDDIPTVPSGQSWMAPDSGVEDTRTGMRHLPPRGGLFERWRARLEDGGILEGAVKDLPAEEREVLEARGVQSLAVVPIFRQSRWCGFLCLEDRQPGRHWSPVELEALRVAARAFGAAIQRRQTEEALAASEAKYRDLLESANDLIQSISPGGHFEFVNRAWLTALGYQRQEVECLSAWDVIHPRHHEHCRKIMERIMHGDSAERIEVDFVTKGGELISVEGSLTRRLEDGRTVATLGIFRDITERKQVDRMKQEFVSTVSHELRTPLTSIVASLGLLSSGRLAEKPEAVSDLLVVARRNSDRLLQLINDLLDLQKLAAGKMRLRIEPLDPAPLLQEVLEDISTLAESFKVRLQLTHPGKPLQALADRDRLMQVFNNLLSNAIKFSPAGEVVLVKVEPCQDKVLFSVADHGEGIPPEFQHRIFDKFTQVDSSPTRKAGGSGLGLSIVKGLVEQMQGQVWLESRPGEGTTFFVELPALPN